MSWIHVISVLGMLGAIAGLLAYYERFCDAMRFAMAGLMVLFCGLFYDAVSFALTGAVMFTSCCITAWILYKKR